MGEKAHGWAVWEINRQWKLFDLLPSVPVLQKEAKEGKKDKDKDSDKEEEDSGKQEDRWRWRHVLKQPTD